MRGVIRDPMSAWAASISVSVMPPSRRGVWTSVLYQAVSVSTILRRPSPYARSNRSITSGRIPEESWSSISGTTDNSSSRT